MDTPKRSGSPTPGSNLLQQVPAGTWIFRRGDPGETMFIIQEGEVELVREFGDHTQVLFRLGPGDFFGELAVLDSRPHTTSARAVADCRLLPVDAAAFDQLLRDYPEVSVRMLRALATRLRKYEEEAARAQKVAAGVLAGAKRPEAPIEPPASSSATSRPAPPAYLFHPASGRKLPLPPSGNAVIGRLDPVTQQAPEIDLTQLDTQRSTSRRHARIHWSQGRFWIREDVGTANGTFLENQRLNPGVDYPLTPGQRLRFGRVDLVFELGSV